MVCKTTSPAKRRAGGFTYVEFLVAGTISVVIATVVVSFSLFSGRSLLAMSNSLELDAQSRSTLDQMTKQIRRVTGVTAFTTNAITFLDYDGKALKFTYDPSAKSLTKVKESVSTVMLQGCDSLTFGLCAREPNDGSWTLTPTTDITKCKAVFLSWNCSRKFADSKLNTANMTSATVVIRTK